MHRVFFGLAAVGVGVVATAASATDDPILTRQKLMQANGAGFYGVAGGMLKGEIPFEARAANAVLRTSSAVAYSFGDYFPEGSETGGDTRASPKIWEDMAGFQAALEKFRADADAAAASKPQDLETFRTVIAQLGENCQSCHEEYRMKDD
jgi:cytochrome c556